MDNTHSAIIMAVFLIAAGMFLSYLAPVCPAVNVTVVTTTTGQFGGTTTTTITTAIPKPDCQVAKNSIPITVIAIALLILGIAAVRSFRV